MNKQLSTRRRYRARSYREHGGLPGFFHNIRADFLRNKVLYFIAIPIVVWFILFAYLPMGGVVIAFQNFRPRLGITGSEWVGLQHFQTFFSSIYFGRLIRNTIVLSLLDLLFCFPAPIIFALLLNEVRNRAYKRTAQTISYLPYFISTVVLCGLFRDFTQSGGAIANFIGTLIGNPGLDLIGNDKYFRAVYIVMNLWQGFGYGSIIYLSALSSADQELYEAASLDGAGRWKQTLHITLPAIMPTVVMMLIMKMGALLAVSTDKIILLYTPGTYETADVLGSYIYRVGLLDGQYGLTAAVGLFNSVIGFVLLFTTNMISRKVSETSLF